MPVTAALATISMPGSIGMCLSMTQAGKYRHGRSGCDVGGQPNSPLAIRAYEPRIPRRTVEVVSYR